MNTLAGLVLAVAVVLSGEAWTERQVMRARFPRKLTRFGRFPWMGWALSDNLIIHETIGSHVVEVA